MRLLLIYLVTSTLVLGSPLFGSSDESSEIQEESTTMQPLNTDKQSNDSQEEMKTTVASSNEEESHHEDQSDRSTEETTVIEETSAPVDHTKIDVAQRIDEEEKKNEERGEEKESEEERSTVHPPPELPTAMAQMMGQLEIRLIDENKTQTHVESVIEPPPLSPITPYVTDGQMHPDTTPIVSGEEKVGATWDPNEIEDEHKSNVVNGYDVKWKKVEYVSDTVIDLETTTTVHPNGMEETENNHANDANEEVPTSNPDEMLPSTEEIAVETTTTLSPMDQVALQKIQSAIELRIAKKMPEGPFPDAVTDDDLPVIEGINVDDEEDDPEPVEECLANRHQLAEEVVHRMEKQVERLSKMVRKLGKQQSQYCTQAADDTTDRQLFTDTYSQCPIWREEKIVHYYKLMRITYCADYGKWPNGQKMMKTYGQYLPLFETLYAFQKQ
ncbi:hypothetical protein PFISCL1PPCAC_1717 [Pristionchus fissidentatus]|uniref:Uncharacterized protein n=1 Tax=Pristionchus fissidentatus TaxID=1538716 RepID=A0AAV5UW80_9BILA|nr:hypothetical protein PFISCL1PPCAC_1717 [Pristionchus fissidentatus]